MSKRKTKILIVNEVFYNTVYDLIMTQGDDYREDYARTVIAIAKSIKKHGGVRAPQ